MTHTILQDLHRDHDEFSKIAALIGAELDGVAVGSEPDYGLLEDAMSYVIVYPDTHHHPTEHIVFAQLRRVSPDAADAIDGMLAQHVELTAAGREFLVTIRAVEEEAVVTRADFLRKGRRFIDLLRAQMNAEEDGLYRLAAERLGSADWETIGKHVAELYDSLFEASVGADFRRLWQRITAHHPIG